MGIEKHPGLRVAALLSVGFVIPETAHANVIISPAATQNVNCSSGIRAPTAKKAGFNTSDLENYIDNRVCGPRARSKYEGAI
jgi:hypothetical protein